MKLLLNILTLSSFYLVFKDVSSCCVNVTVVYVTERSAITDLIFMINRTVGLTNIAMKKAQEIVQQKVNLNFIMKIVDLPGCTPMKFGALVSELYHTHEIDAIIGPGCTPAVATIARMAAAWNLPHITYGGTDTYLGNKTEFSTLTRLSFTMNLFARFYMEVFKEFGWTDVANIYDESQYLAKLSGTSLQKSFVEARMNSYVIPFSGTKADTASEIVRALREAMKVSRVFLIASHGRFLRQFAIKARQMGMKPGDYSIIYFVSDPSTPYIGNYKWKRGDDLDKQARTAYENVMVVRPRRPLSQEFEELERATIEQAFLLYNFTWPEGNELGILHVGQYDSFTLYARTLLAGLEAGENYRNGLTFNKRIWNASFTGLGGITYVNKNGDRDTDFTLQDMDSETGEFQTVAQYLGYIHRFQLIPDVPVHWPDNAGPTLNKPTCGFVGELCQVYTFPMYGTIAISFAAVLLVITVGGLILLRQIRAEAAIQSQWWRVKWEEITIQTKSERNSFNSKFLQRDEESLPSSQDVSGKGALPYIGVYKAMQVHIRKLRIKSLTTDRKLLVELKEMRDVACPNLTRLIGVCSDPNRVCIITEFCSRGSLQDILQNDSIRLDEYFRTSLINDIVQGMNYIHSSPIYVHGRLSSSSCVIDSRFVLKITAFGLPSLFEMKLGSVGTSDNNTEYVSRYALWMAPELLRILPLRQYTQPGDVYSFAIIMYEMCTRKQPYVTEMSYISVADVIRQIKSIRPEPKRPFFGDESSYPNITKLAIQCWSEKPEDRPTFANIRKTLYMWNRGKPHAQNVLDTLLHRMEQYANNLESLVEERTNALRDEKKRSEELLYQVLPKSVASQLRDGHSVIPEAFREVTIYFSDIVGFTTISAASTPLEVVDFLNDVYLCFDSIIDNFDVYKVETIGDAYMVVSGLPVRNGNEHARQISRMSLRILEQVKNFVIRHQPQTPLRARIGIHSGPAVAGVVGMKMPRYCLFGDTVNIASRMESSGKPMMIHISDSTKQLLEMFGNYAIIERGFIDVKGKGVMLTHWLIEECPTDSDT